jgi:hypothetical protein
LRRDTERVRKGADRAELLDGIAGFHREEH